MLDLSLPASDKAATPVRGLVLYFAATFAITWLLQFPGVFAQRGLIPIEPATLIPLVLLGVFGPTFAAMIVTRLEGGSIRALFSGLRQWRVNPVWYVVALGLQGALLSLGLAVYSLATGSDAKWLYFPDAQRLVAMVIISFAEEIGWRGFALPRLQQRFSPVRASIILGVLWALWHIPMLMGASVPMRLMPLMVLLLVPGTIVYTWIYNRTRGSLLLAVFTHMGSHLNNSHLALPGDTTPLIVHTVMFWIAAFVLVLVDRKALRTTSASTSEAVVV